LANCFIRRKAYWLIWGKLVGFDDQVGREPVSLDKKPEFAPLYLPDTSSLAE
jgi:hypothetical protein